MKKRWYFLPVAAVLVLVIALLPGRIASAAEICGQWDTVSVMGGEYTIQNNVWGATTAQCINVPSTNSNAFTVTSSSHNQNSVASYPSVFKGCHFGDCTANSGMPIPVNQVTSAPFSWNVTRVNTGVWNIAAEAWFSPITDSTDGYNGGAELMIWLDYMGMQPAGSRIGTASIAGASWEVWYANIGWNYIAYRRIGAVSSINADLKAFINDSVSRGYIQPSWYLHDFEAGTELMTGGAGFASNSFSFAVNGGTPPPTTPPPTTPPPGACQVAYVMNQWNSGFTADVKITNNSSSTIRGWTLAWSFANGQQITGSWNATVSQSGANVTASNPASYWNGTIGANGGSVSFGFQATHTGTNTVPTTFTLNGVACNGGTPPPTTPPPTTPPPTTPPPTTPPPTTPPPTTPPPTTPPPTTPPPTTPPPGVCQVAYVMNQWNSGFTADVKITNNSSSTIRGWTLVWSFANGQQITGSWNATVSQSGANVTASNPASYWNGTIGANGGSVSFGFQATHTGTNTVPTTFTLNGVACNGGTPPPTTPPPTTPPPTTPPPTTPPPTTPPPTTPPPGTHLDNPFVGAVIYRNVDYVASVNAAANLNPTLAARMRQVGNYPTFVWMDTIAAVNGTGGYSRSLVGHMQQAVAQGANTIQIVVYDLPNRDCSALASNGELLIAEDGFNRYKTEYINPIASAVGQFPNLRVIAVIEPDSLPNLHTNLSFAKCQEANGPGGYRDGIVYALNTLGAYSNFYSYVDIGHHGWLGWQDSNFIPASALIADTIKAANKGVNSIDGFVSNTANTSALVEPYHTANQMINGQPARSASYHDWNTYIDELSYAQAWRSRMISLGFPSTLGMLIDTSRNGWGGTARPTGPSTSLDLNTFVNESRIDRRIHKGNWCNQSGAGIGERPRANPATGVDSYVWVKPPGESDGSSTLVPIGPDNPDGKGFDQMCDPTYTGNSLNGNNMTGALPNAPVSGRWFQAQFEELVRNAFPPFQ